MSISSRKIYLFILACCVGLLAYALYAQYVDGLHPCPLCITQRAFFTLTGLFALLGLIFHPQQTGRYITGGLMLASCGVQGHDSTPPSPPTPRSYPPNGGIYRRSR